MLYRYKASGITAILFSERKHTKSVFSVGRSIVLFLSYLAIKSCESSQPSKSLSKTANSQVTCRLEAVKTLQPFSFLHLIIKVVRYNINVKSVKA